MTNIEFGVYFVPENNTNFYEKGSKIVGYDIRERKTITNNQIGDIPINKEWNRSSQKFGFHMTLTDIVTIEEKQLPNIISYISNTFNKICGKKTISLECNNLDIIGNRKNILGIKVNKTEHLQRLHNSLIEIQKEGSSSFYTRKKEIDPEWENLLTETQKNNMKKYLSPYILSEFEPHFTLFDPFETQINTESVLNEIYKTINLPFSIVLQKLSIVTKKHKDLNFIINKEITNF